MASELSRQEDEQLLAREQLARKMAVKILARLEEAERQRRIAEQKEEADHPDELRQKTYDKMASVQEDLVRCLARMKAREMAEGVRARVHSNLNCLHYCCLIEKNEMCLGLVFIN